MEPRVTIITVCEKADADFKALFQSVVDQTFCWFEWIIIGGKDLEELNGRDSRIRLLDKEEDGFTAARSDRILYLDVHALITPTYVETWYWIQYFNPDMKISDRAGSIEFSPVWKVNEFPSPRVTIWKDQDERTVGKLNIMMLIPWMEMGGSDKFNLDIVRKIDKERFSVTIVTTVKGENEWKPLFEMNTKDIQVLPDFLSVSDYAEYISYLIVSRGIKAVFLSNSYYGYYLVPWLKSMFPDVVIVDYVHLEERYWRNGGYARLSGLSGCCLDKTFVCNEVTNHVLTEKFDRKKESVETLYIGVDKDRFDSAKIPYGEMRKKYGIPLDKKVVLFPCRIHPQKRPFLMLEIAKRLVKKEENICFFVAGDGPQWKELCESIKKSGIERYFICPGQIAEMEKVYRDSDVTLICSLKEGISLTAYESCAMMTPVVTADVGGQKELIDDSVGRVVPMLQTEEDIDNRCFSEAEIESYVAAITEILADETAYQKMCGCCREKIMTGFSTDVMIEKLEKYIEEFIHIASGVPGKENQFTDMQGLAENYLATYVEAESFDHLLSGNYGQDMHAELKRIANSRWGSRLIRLAMKFKLNKLFR